MDFVEGRKRPGLFVVGSIADDVVLGIPGEDDTK
jgi:hypothetical protein